MRARTSVRHGLGLARMLFDELVERLMHLPQGCIDITRVGLALRLQGRNRGEQGLGIGTVDVPCQLVESEGLRTGVLRPFLACGGVPQGCQYGVESVYVCAETLGVGIAGSLGKAGATGHDGDQACCDG